MRSVLDTAVAVETPEGIVLELRPAGLSARCYAFILDWLIRIVGLNILVLALSTMKGVGIGIYFILFFLSEWIYPVVFELSRWGATPGKRAFDLKVVMDSGLPVTPAASLTRNLIRVVDFFPALYGFAIITMLTRRDFKRLGDIAASTLVVYQSPKPAKITLPKIASLPPAFALPPEDQAALIALAARASKLTTERVDELAALAAPICAIPGQPQVQPGPALTSRVLAIAQWLLGRR